MKELVKTLCHLPGVSGREDAVRAYIEAQIRPYADQLWTDAMGNLLAHVPGKKPSRSGKKVMLAAHMDEVGVIVTGITEEGYLQFDFVGGIDRRVVIGKTVRLGEQALPGVIGLKAIHLVRGEEQKKVPQAKDMYIDIGAVSKAEAETKIALGEVGCFDDHVVEFGNGYLRAKAIDDRVGCAVLIKLIQCGLPTEAWFAFTVQEEVGCRGANAAAYAIQPDAALILEGTTAADLPSQSGSQKVCCPGHGPVVPFMDGSTIYDHRLFAELTALARDRQIPWQTKTRISGGTDASVIQRKAAGAKVAAISAAVRYIHSPSCVGCIADFEGMRKLAYAYLEEQA